MQPEDKIQAALEQLRNEFIDGGIERLDLLDNLLLDMRKRTDDFEEHFRDMVRHIHSMKGQGATFDFSSITEIAHALEDFIEVAPALGDQELDGIQVYLDRMRGVLESGENPPPDVLRKLLRLHDISAEEIYSRGTKTVEMLLVMPRGLQRKIIAQELGSCGFRVIIADDPISAIGLAIAKQPDIALSTMFMNEMSGMELVRALRVIKKTKAIKFILMTSDTNDQEEAFALPSNTVVVRKGVDFTEDLTLALMKWGLFGKIAA